MPRIPFFSRYCPGLIVLANLICGSSFAQEAEKEPRAYPDRKPISASKTFKTKPGDLRDTPGYEPVPGDETYVCFGDSSKIFVSEQRQPMEEMAGALRKLHYNEISEMEFEDILHELRDAGELSMAGTFARVKILEVRWPSGGESAGSPIARIRFLTGPNRGKSAWTPSGTINFPRELPKPEPVK